MAAFRFIAALLAFVALSSAGPASAAEIGCRPEMARGEARIIPAALSGEGAAPHLRRSRELPDRDAAQREGGD